MALADYFQRFFRRSSADVEVLRLQREADKEAAEAKRIEAAESRRESERRWYARLPIMAIATLCAAVVALTGLLALATHYVSPAAPQDGSRPVPQPVDPPASAPQKPPVKMSLGARSLFDFKSADLRIEDDATRQSLDNCLAPKPTSIRVVGHTDCIGKDKYNQGLSQQRVEAVKRYFVDKGIDDAVITATGLGFRLAKLDPFCRQEVRETPANVARLAPYRRVDITCEYEAVAT